MQKENLMGGRIRRRRRVVTFSLLSLLYATNIDTAFDNPEMTTTAYGDYMAGGRGGWKSNLVFFPSSIEWLNRKRKKKKEGRIYRRDAIAPKKKQLPYKSLQRLIQSCISRLPLAALLCCVRAHCAISSFFLSCVDWMFCVLYTQEVAQPLDDCRSCWNCGSLLSSPDRVPLYSTVDVLDDGQAPHHHYHAGVKRTRVRNSSRLLLLLLPNCARVCVACFFII